jgi:dTDP-4-dehydrorhamnose reductase
LKILVTGADGMLGRDFCDVARELGHDITATDIGDLDVTQVGAVREALSKAAPEAVFHFGAMTDVDRCETHPDEAHLTNVIGTENVALCCAEADVPLVFSSTGSLFGGEKATAYTEYDDPLPVSQYGKTKYLGERIIQRLTPKHFICRAGWMFGGGPEDKKFVARIIGLAAERDEIYGVTDKTGTPTYTVDYSKRLFEILETGRYGLYHAGNEGYCTRYEFACKIVELAGLKNCRVMPVVAAKIPMPAHRPRLEALDNYKCRLLGMKRMRSWELALKEYIEARLA